MRLVIRDAAAADLRTGVAANRGRPARSAGSNEGEASELALRPIAGAPSSVRSANAFPRKGRSGRRGLRQRVSKGRRVGF